MERLHSRWPSPCLAFGLAACLLALTLGPLVGCGGDSHRAPETAATGVPLAAPQLSVAAQSIKTLAFRWSAVPGATHYRLLEDRDGEAGPRGEQLLAELAADRLDFTQQVLLPERLQARYRLQACDGAGCSSSPAAAIEAIERGVGYFKASNAAARDEFGEGLAISADGRLLAVGAYLEDGLNLGIDSVPQRGGVGTDVGAVYVFRRDESGWVQEAYLKPAQAAPGAWFGYRLAWSGDGRTLLVGAPHEGSGGSGVNAVPTATPGLSLSGALYVFERDAGGHWGQSGFIKAQSAQANANFGAALGLSRDGRWAAVGQPATALGGSVALYERQAGAWVSRGELRRDHTEAGDNFGGSLQFDAQGRTLVVGAWAEDSGGAVAGADNTRPESGAAYVFVRDDSGAWLPMADLKSPQPAVNGYFGAALGLSGDGQTLVVGEAGEPTTAGPSQGRVHVYRHQGAAWVHERAFVSPQADASGAFGDKLALSADGSTLAIANPWDSAQASGMGVTPVLDGQAPLSGAVLLYRREAGGDWSAPVYTKAPNNQRELYFGWSLALSATGDTLAVYGSDFSTSSGIGGDQSDRSGQWTGAVYLY